MHLHKHPILQLDRMWNFLQHTADLSWLFSVSYCRLWRNPSVQSELYLFHERLLYYYWPDAQSLLCLRVLLSSFPDPALSFSQRRSQNLCPAPPSHTLTHTHVSRFWKASPDVVVLAEDHAAFAVAGTAVLAQLSVAAGAFEAARVPVPLHREEQEAVRDTTPASCTRPARCPAAAAHHRYCGCFHPAVHHCHWRVKGKRNHWRLDIKKVSKMRPNKSVSVMLTPNLRLRLTF